MKTKILVGMLVMLLFITGLGFIPIHAEENQPSVELTSEELQSEEQVEGEDVNNIEGDSQDAETSEKTNEPIKPEIFESDNEADLPENNSDTSAFLSEDQDEKANTTESVSAGLQSTKDENDEEELSQASLNSTAVKRVAKVGDQIFATLHEAVASVDSVGSITIIDDIWIYDAVIIPTGKSITITDDGSERNICNSVYNNQTGPIFLIENGAELTIQATANDNLTLEADGITGFSSEARDTGNIVHNKGTFNLESGTINCGAFAEFAQFMGSVYVDENSTFNMSGGIIHKMDAYGSWYTSPVVVSSGAVFNLSGGEIKDNENNFKGRISGGGGVLLFVWSDDKKPARMYMTGGVISGNSANNGGGIYMTGNTELTMTGGLISNNTAFAGDGGGVSVSAISQIPLPGKTKFVMDGGYICENKARNGGGVYVNSDGVYLKSGYIEKNTATYYDGVDWSGHGGGVYVSEVPRVLSISNTIVTENTATASTGINKTTSGMGGGLWACPTGSIKLTVTNGIAVFGNKAKGPDTAGDDVVKVKLNSSLLHHGTLTLPNRMLGGGEVKWYRDGQVKDGMVGAADATVPRYDVTNPGLPLNIKQDSDRFALKAVTSEEAIKRAYEEATLFIRYNTAAHGGGIGTNGDITMPNYGDPDWKLKVEKSWAPDILETEKKAAEIFLQINGHILDSIILDKDNAWKGEFSELPDPETLINQKITVIEGERITQSDGTEIIQETSHWDVTYEDLAAKEDYTLLIKVSNKKLPTLIPTETSVEVTATNVQVTKTWVDDNDKAGQRPEYVIVKLLADGADTGQSLVLSEANNWKGTFTNLVEYEFGQKVKYSIQEVNVDNNYTSMVTGNAESGFKLINTLKTNDVPLEIRELPRTGARESTGWSGLIIIAGALILISKNFWTKDKLS